MKILLVEDDLALARAISKGLEKDYEVDIANTFEDGILKAKKLIYHVILLDIQLPDGNGLDFISDFRKYGQTPILLLSVLNDDRTVIQGLNLGADDYIAKPFNNDVLQARVRSCLRRYHTQNPIVEIGELKIDTIHHKVYKNQEEIQLSAIEQELFFALVNARGQILTRDFLLENFWDAKNRFVEDNTLSVTIRRLKTKIGKEYILTKYNVGYYFKEQ